MSRNPIKDTSRSATAADKLVGTRVRFFREAAGLTLSDLGQQLNISHQQLQKYETGTNRISVGKMVEIASALGQPIDAFVQDEGAPQSPTLRLSRAMTELKRLRTQTQAVMATLDKLIDGHV